MYQYLDRLVDELKIRGYSRRTIKSYHICVRKYLEDSHYTLEGFGYEKVRDFLLKKVDAGASPQTVNLYLNALKFFYAHILKISPTLPIKCLKRSKKLPTVLSHQEILRILEVISNPKHRLMIALAYGAGLRVSEIVALKIKDLDPDNLLITVRQGKGLKDRLTLLPSKLKHELGLVAFGHNKDTYIFQSERGGGLTTRTAQKIFSTALMRSDIHKDATFHSLRHSFATHLLENGIDIRYIQELLGHANIKTTLIYTRVATNKLTQIPSPY